jgi:hypothetical protein
MEKNCMMSSFVICNTQQALFERYQIKKIWVGHMARMGETRVAHKGCVVKPEGNRPLE